MQAPSPETVIKSLKVLDSTLMPLHWSHFNPDVYADTMLLKTEFFTMTVSPLM
jgi:hypothetical protein